MRTKIRLAIGACLIVGLSFIASADQAPTPQLSRVMRAKLSHSQAILGALVTSDWGTLDKESRALALAVRDPAWIVSLTEPAYLRQSDAFTAACQQLIEASSKRDLEAAGDAQVALTMSCVRCHVYMTRRRTAK